jgi:Lar family restriction alleviation protein
MEKILPCPFCGGKDIRFDCHKAYTSPTGKIWSMCCYNCGAQFPNRYKKELLLKAWNTRHSQIHLQQRR